MCILNCSALGQLNGSMAAIASPRTSQCGEAPTSQKRMKPVTPHAHGGYKASFEACFMDLGCLEKHNFLTALLENSRKHHGVAWFSVNSYKASPLGPVSGLAVVVPLQCFQSHNYDKTDVTE